MSSGWKLQKFVSQVAHTELSLQSPPACIFIPEFYAKPHLCHSKCWVFFVPGSNAGCREKPEAARRLFVSSLWWFQKHALLSLPGRRSPAESFSLPERPITMHRRAAAVMSQAIQGHPRLPNGLLRSSFLHQLSHFMSFYCSFAVCYSRLYHLA